MKGAVVVTGASSGIGAATVERLAGDGYRVFGTVRRSEDFARVVERGGSAILLDVTRCDSVLRARDAIARAADGVGFAALVNNAGIPCAGPLEMVPLARIREAFETNVIGLISVTQIFLPMLRRSHGTVVNVGSISGRIAFPFVGPYAATKFALEAISDSLRRELLGHVNVVLIEPGSVRTAIWDKIAPIELNGSVYREAALQVRDRALAGAADGIKPGRIADAISSVIGDPSPPARIRIVRSEFKTRVMEFLPDRLLDSLIARSLRRR